jgi:CheY-like chemotaxis protein
MRSNKPILLVDDDRIDVMTTIRALKEINVSNPVQTCENGEVALEYLLDPANPRPCIIILDLNMPRMNGVEFLQKRHEYPKLRSIPVIVMTTSDDEQDKLSSYELGAVGYILKPVVYESFVKAVTVLNMYWTLSELSEGD